MRNRRSRSPRLEPLESLTLTSSLSARPLDGTLHGTFFAHRGSPSSGTVYSLFASGEIGPTGPTLLVGGFQKAGFTARGAGGGNLALESESHRGNLFVRLTELSGPTAVAPGQYLFSYAIAPGSGPEKAQGGSGTVAITLRPINTNIHGQPASNPGFFGNSTLTFHSGAAPATAPVAGP